ncbi:MAG: TonB-dependent receptor [Calditrichia bacterium]
MKTKKVLQFATLLLLVAGLLLPGSLLAGTTGKIAGRVIDASTGEPLPGANIYVEGYPFGAATDIDGFFFIVNIPPGRYTIVAQVLGYEEVRVENVKVNVDLTTKLDYKLRPQALEMDEQITVVAERPLVQKDVTNSSTTISKEEIEVMPVESVNDLVSLEAGVVAGHFRGGRLGEVAYLVDGIPVNDPFNNGAGIGVENSSIQQLEIISGTFNAEYGQAMSGVINIITKDGSNNFEVNANAYAGAFLTPHDDLFPNLSGFKGGLSQNFQATLSGPVPLLKGLTFFATGRYFHDDGHLYGRRVYNISDTSAFAPNGDSAWVSMSDMYRSSFHGKLTYYLIPTIKLNYSFLNENSENRYYDHGYRLTPDGIMTHYRNNYNHSFIINHTISKSAYHTLKFSTNIAKYKGYVFENPYDPRYVIPEQGLPASGYTFRSGGNQNSRYDRVTTSNTIKYDFASQINKQHKIGLGVEYRKHNIDNFWTAFQTGVDNFGRKTIVYPQDLSAGQDNYEVEPIEFSAYIQDKMEYEDLIINAGLRFDYFDPKTDMLSDPKNPEFNPLFPSGNKKVDPKLQFSPRLGVAFPISASGVIHVSYGHFFQIPNFEHLYQGIKYMPDGTTRFLVDKSGLNTIIGNPDLKAQQTVSYEFGLQQVLYKDLVLNFTAYYRDIRNLVQTEIIETYDKYKYGRYVNKDYANVRGIIINLEKRFSSHWGAAIDYTYQFAEGNASDPRTVFQDNQADPPREPEKKMLPLDWDQRSTLNISANVGSAGNWNVSLIGKFGSGTPYTADPTFTYFNVSFLNNRTKPAFYSFDLRAEKNFELGPVRVQLFMLVYNLFDRKNELGVYGSTGRANRDLNTKYAGEIQGLNTIEEYVNNPSMYSAPRQVRLGINFGF